MDDLSLNDWADYLDQIATREARLDQGLRRTCGSCREYRVNPPRKICYRCRWAMGADKRRRRAKALRGVCMQLNCRNQALGNRFCIRHGSGEQQ